MDNDQPQGNTDVSARLDAYFAAESGEVDTNKTPQPAVTEQQPEPMPSSEQKPTEEVKQPEITQDQGDTGDDLTLPESASERTKEQFEKLKKRLAEVEAKAQAKAPLETSEYGNSVLDAFRPKVDPTVPQVQGDFGFLNQQQVQTITNQFIDSDGNVDINGLNQALYQQNDLAKQAIARAQQAEEKIARFEETQQAKEAHQAFPELDPLNKEKFDPAFFEAVRDRVLRRNYFEGKNLSLLDVAKEVTQGYKKSTVDEAKVKEQAIEEFKKTQELRNQGPIQSGRGEQRQSFTQEELRERTRKGDSSALDERLRALGILKSS